MVDLGQDKTPLLVQVIHIHHRGLVQEEAHRFHRFPSVKEGRGPPVQPAQSSQIQQNRRQGYGWLGVGGQGTGDIPGQGAWQHCRRGHGD